MSSLLLEVLIYGRVLILRFDSALEKERFQRSVDERLEFMTHCEVVLEDGEDGYQIQIRPSAIAAYSTTLGAIQQ